MSASSKKKLRKEQTAAELTQKQQKEQLEAKKLRNSAYQEKLAEGIAQGIFTYLDEKESN